MIFLLNIFFLIFGTTLSAPKTTETYSNSLILREPDEFYLYWNYNETDIVIETHAKTSGWSSFGISPTGGMDNSDVVVSWINNDGSHHFSDRHIRGRQVLKDKVQNWFPIAIFQQDDYLITKFTRKIKICDESNEDLDIPEGTPMTIFAYGSVLVDDDIGYHNTNRGTKTVPLINSLNAAPKINLDEVEQVEFRANYTLDKSKDTEYFCTMFKLPVDWAKEKRHLIRYETLYTPGTEENLHHWTVNECGPDFEKEFLKSNSIPDPAFCYSPNWIKALSYCRKISLAWAVGGSIIQDFPEDLAYPLGGSDQETKYFFLEIHYDNPRLKNGVKDYSGVRFYATKNYRKNEFGVFTVGAEESAQGIILPPRAESFKLNYACSRDCTDMLFEQQDEIKVFSTLPHAHLLGKEIYTKVIRDGKEVAYLANNKFYDFNNQYYNFLNKPVTLKKGDEIVTKCVYGTNKKANFTYGGLATYNEMW
ncbi:unnamed protein product [Brachionus calyciflorus]|uniref:DOMON domain-containing protein n=1 Tax=Brachionus calyciflorus TaxID=104777 RepID=A0A814HC64_9BILA|nr:unnamed protein product [Brachionus calyciflorus]